MSTPAANTPLVTPATHPPRRLGWQRWIVSPTLILIGCLGALAGCYFASRPYADCWRCGFEVREAYFSPHQWSLLQIEFRAHLPNEVGQLAERHPEAIVPQERIDESVEADANEAAGTRSDAIVPWWRLIELDDPPLAIDVAAIANPTAHERDFVALLQATEDTVIVASRAAYWAERAEARKKDLGPDSLRCPLCRKGELRLKPLSVRY